MTTPNYPSSELSHRRADQVVHIVGLTLILTAGAVLITKSVASLDTGLTLAVVIYVLCALLSNLASCAYHFLPWHSRRKLLRRMDHAAIYLSITGTFTPFFVQANTTWTITLLCVCWGLTLAAIWHKVTHETVKTRWSTASYLGLGAIGLSAFSDMGTIPLSSLWCIGGGAVCYVLGTTFYARKTIPYRYAIWHTWVIMGGAALYAGIWLALLPS